ncbi:conserved Plasmodium protein, unknown function [Plasmodium malariae]|uniref:Uncharacterized protein n=1 Tax=Plasmodium malariae TaxID=5858 RepID=A0A1A8VQH6_PLAMA|nr:conserved Plasmodium protein, unknown function [Plasmodium malariae]
MKIVELSNCNNVNVIRRTEHEQVRRNEGREEDVPIVKNNLWGSTQNHSESAKKSHSISYSEEEKKGSMTNDTHNNDIKTNQHAICEEVKECTDGNDENFFHFNNSKESATAKKQKFIYCTRSSTKVKAQQEEYYNQEDLNLNGVHNSKYSQHIANWTSKNKNVNVKPNDKGQPSDEMNYSCNIMKRKKESSKNEAQKISSINKKLLSFNKENISEQGQVEICSPILSSSPNSYTASEEIKKDSEKKTKEKLSNSCMSADEKVTHESKSLKNAQRGLNNLLEKCSNGSAANLHGTSNSENIAENSSFENTNIVSKILCNHKEDNLLSLNSSKDDSVILDDKQENFISQSTGTLEDNATCAKWGKVGVISKGNNTGEINENGHTKQNNDCSHINNGYYTNERSIINNNSHSSQSCQSNEISPNEKSNPNGDYPHSTTSDIDKLKYEIKKELYNKLSIALDVNMCFNTDEEYYMKFLRKKKYRNYVLNISKFIIILGKQLYLSIYTISLALHYMHKYNQKYLKRKKSSIAYLIGGACIFLAWKLREDFEDHKKSKKLHDIPKVIFKLLNYFYKKKRLKKKIKKIELDLMINHYQTNLEISNEDTFKTFMQNVRAREIEKYKENNKFNPTDDSQISDMEKKKKKKKKRKISTHDDRKKRNESSLKKTDVQSIDEKKSKEKKEKEKEKNIKSLYYDLLVINSIISEGHISDINNISDVSDCFSSYLSECNSKDVSEYEFASAPERSSEGERQQEKIVEKCAMGNASEGNTEGGNTSEGKINGQTNDEGKKKHLIKKFKKLCKQQKRNIYISSSKWVLNNSGQKLQLMQKIITYYEREVLKSFNYFIKPKILSFDLFPTFLGQFVLIMEDYIQENQVNHLEKLSFLTILDFYKTPLCLIFTSKEIIVTCILKAYISLKIVYGQLNFKTLSFEDFESKVTKFIRTVSYDDPIRINRIKMALREMRQVHH